MSFTTNTMKTFSGISFLKKISHSRILVDRSFCVDVSKTEKKHLLIGKSGNITTIGINRPPKRNCINADTICELKQAFQDFQSDDSAQVAILHGEGGNFCSGFDLDEIIQYGYEPILEAISDFDMYPFCEKPVVGALSGYAVAEGFELALGCDLRVIENTAMLGFIGRRFGVPTMFNGSKILSQLIGGSRALDLSITGRLIKGDAADEWGLAARLVATGTGLGQAISLASSITKFSESGLQHDKMTIWQNYQQQDSKRFQYNKDRIENLRKLASEDVKRLAVRFKEDGIGKHGKFHLLTKREEFTWETENEIKGEWENKKYNKSKKNKVLDNFEDLR